MIISIADKAYIDMKYDASTPIGLTWAGIVSVRTSYDWDPATAAAGVPEAAVLGVEAPLWGETTATITDDAQASIARARVEPGTTTRLHRLLGITERYLILAGRGRAEIGDLAPVEVGAGDVVVIPPGVAQRIANTGDEDLLFAAICTPRFLPECYQDLDPEAA